MEFKILTVDDDRVVRLLVKAVFLPFACRVLEAADGAEGLEQAGRHRPDLILLDCEMPAMNGLEMLTRLREKPETHLTPVIMLTGSSARENVLNFARLGVRSYLLKPFNSETILARVSEILSLETRKALAAGSKGLEDPLDVLVVEDQPEMFDQVKDGLAATHWTIRGAASAAEAIARCRDSIPEIILISLELPDGAALRLFGSFRADIRTKRTPILGLCAKNARNEQAAAEKLGFRDIVAKPIEAAELKAKIEATLDLDVSPRYFQERDGVLVMPLPAAFDPAVAHEIFTCLRRRLTTAAASGLRWLVVDMTPIPRVDPTLLKILLEISRLAPELPLRFCLVASDALGRDLHNYQETHDWEVVPSYPEALAILKG